MNSVTYRLLWILLAIVIFFRFGNMVYEKKDEFIGRGYANQYPALQAAFYSSQYFKKVNASSIPDETFESFVGGTFLRGLNPILIVHEHPPMGRYIIALSIYFFDNAKTLIIPILLISILGIYLIAKLVLKNALLALIPLGIFINEPLFLGKLFYAPLLEPIQLPFIFFSLYFFIKGVLDKKYMRWFILSSLMLGFVISIRFFILGLFLALAMLTYFLINRKINKKMLFFLLSLPLSLIVLILSYTRTIQDGYSIYQIFGIQKYMFFYHKSKFISPFSYWDLLLFNRWHTWWGDRTIISDSTWIMAWPISTALTFGYLFIALVKKIAVSPQEQIIFLWIIMYSLLLSVGNSTTRYFLPLVPFFYILATAFVVRIIKKKI